MTGRANHSDLTRRMAHLSAEKRELLQRLLARENADRRDSLPVPLGLEEQARRRAEVRVGDVVRVDGELRITRDALANHEGEEQGKHLYELVNRNLDRIPFATHTVFLNLGYVANENPRFSPIELPRYCLNRNCTQLALEVIADVDLSGREVADVGCGRGGTIAVMKTSFSPRLLVGVDFSRSAIAFCKRTHSFGCAHFVEGNAQALPLASARFDVVTSIESACSYPDIPGFYREMFRVLQPGGYFLYADVIPRAHLAERRKLLIDIGFVIESERDITSNVILSCDETAKTHRVAIAGEHDEEIMGHFLGLPGSSAYEQMRAGGLLYVIYKNRRSGARSRRGAGQRSAGTSQ